MLIKSVFYVNNLAPSFQVYQVYNKQSNLFYSLALSLQVLLQTGQVNSCLSTLLSFFDKGFSFYLSFSGWFWFNFIFFYIGLIWFLLTLVIFSQSCWSFLSTPDQKRKRQFYPILLRKLFQTPSTDIISCIALKTVK